MFCKRKFHDDIVRKLSGKEELIHDPKDIFGDDAIYKLLEKK